MVEVALSAVVLMVSIGTLAGAVMSSMRLARANEETAIAFDAASEQVDLMQAVGFGQIFDTFTAAPADGFAVQGLRAQEGDADGMCGRILFPVGAGGELREDVADLSLGMPRDLNGDGAVDAFGHDGDYVLLPVTIRVEWRGVTGDRFIELDRVLFP